MGESEIQPSRWDGIASPRIPAVKTAGYLQMFLRNKTAPPKWRKKKADMDDLARDKQPNRH
jgi:hypothetical protein